VEEGTAGKATLEGSEQTRDSSRIRDRRKREKQDGSSVQNEI
jgi:hypothetical protein